LKSVQRLIKAHEVQLVNYLVATGLPVGLLINFGETRVEVKRKVRQLNNDQTGQAPNSSKSSCHPVYTEVHPDSGADWASAQRYLDRDRRISF